MARPKWRRVRASAALLRVVHRGKRAAVGVVEREVEDRDVVADARGCDRLRNYDQALVEVPADHHLGRRFAVLLRDGANRGVVDELAAAERAPALDGDAVFLVEGALVALLEARMQFDLVDRRCHAGLADDALEVVEVEVRHADGVDAAFSLQFDQRLPRFDVVPARGRRPVDQEKVELVDAELAHGVVERHQRIVAAMRAVTELAGDEDLAAGYAGLTQRLANAFLVLVALGGVDRAVARPQRLGAAFRGDVRRHLPHAEAELGDDIAIVEYDRRLLRHGAFSLRRVG